MNIHLRPNNSSQNSGLWKVKMITCASKVVVTFFYDMHRKIFIDFLEKGKQLLVSIVQTSCKLLFFLNMQIKKSGKNWNLSKNEKSVSSPRECTNSHISGCNCSNQIAFLPASKDGYFEDLDKSYYQSGITAVECHLGKCIKLNGNYVEKYIQIIQKETFLYLGPEYLQHTSWE